MNSRERCIRAIEREEVDMVPLNIWIEAPEPLNSLMAHLGVEEYDRLLEALGVDYRGDVGLNMVSIRLKGGFKERSYRGLEGRRLYRNMWGVVYAISSDGRTTMHVKHPLLEMELDEYPWPEVDEESIAQVEEARRRYEDYCLMGYTLQAFETLCALFGYNAALRGLITGDKKVLKALDKLFEITFRQAELLVEAGVDQVYNGDDVGAQTTMMISPATWRRYLKPYYQRLAYLVHKGGAFLHLHSDGWIEPIIPDLVEIGVDVLEPLQPEAMDPQRVKEAYGDKLSFEGAISVQRTLPFGTPEEVAEEARERLESLGPTGYILRPSHTITPETPIRNIIALYEAANNYRRVGRR
ncbi:MAG: hypothetical protein DRJ96_06500 [Thermoprotei archaeon]|nr:MAG: hypothetical protein DRJ96_06500 [Thermoprotei archaeon]